MIGGVFFFLYDCKTQTFRILCVFTIYLITAFIISLALSFISVYNNAHFIQYRFNIIPFTYNSNIVGYFINRKKNKLFFGVLQDSLLPQFVSEQD